MVANAARTSTSEIDPRLVIEKVCTTELGQAIAEVLDLSHRNAEKQASSDAMKKEVCLERITSVNSLFWKIFQSWFP